MFWIGRTCDGLVFSAFDVLFGVIYVYRVCGIVVGYG